jgi:hypothetical protein
LCILDSTIVKFRNLKQGTKMTKMIKMSLIAAVAVTGMTSVASAQNLEDAIKGVDFSGNVRYRYTNGEATTPSETNNYRLEFAVKSKVNDMVTATVASSVNASTTDTTGDADPQAAAIKEANFAFALPGVTVIAGKQALATPFASGSLEDQQGTGVVALVPVAGVTVAAGWYLNSDAHTKAAVPGMDIDLNGNNIAAVAVIGAAANVKYAAWYAKVSETDLKLNDSVAGHPNPTTGVWVAPIANTLGGITAGATAVNLNLSAPVGPVNVEVNYAKVDYTNNTNGVLAELSPSQSRVVVSGKVDTVTLAAGYVTVGKDGGDVTLGDDDSSANFGTMEKFTAISLKDTSAFYLAAKAPVGPVTVGLEHGTTSDVDGQTAGDVKFSETKLSVAYAMSKNFTVSGWMTSTAGDKSGTTDYSKLGQNRIEVLYKF